MKIKVLLSMVLALSIVFSFSGNTLAAETYNLGVALGFTGTGTLYSKDQMEGIQVAVDEINKQGGFKFYFLIVFKQGT